VQPLPPGTASPSRYSLSLQVQPLPPGAASPSSEFGAAVSRQSERGFQDSLTTRGPSGSSCRSSRGITEGNTGVMILYTSNEKKSNTGGLMSAQFTVKPFRPSTLTSLYGRG
ncbi:Zinc finger protein 40, partial [Dissostichus eleginoides]